MAGAEIELKPGELFECPHAGFRNQCVGKLLELRPARKASRDVLWVVLALLVGGAALWHFWFSGPRPILKLGVGGQEADLGLIKPGTAGQAELEVRNAGDLELEISDVAVEGAGFSAKPKSLAVAPGKSDKILILFNTPALDDRTENGGGQTGALEPRTSSRFDGSMVLKSNDRRHPDLKVALHVTQEFADPEELLDRTIPGLPKRERSKKAEGGGPAREAGKEKQEEEYELLKDNAELGITIAAKLTSLDQTAGSDGDVKGKIVSFNAGGVQLELERDEVEHEGGKAWVLTKKYGKIRIAGGYSGLCVWLTKSQKLGLKALRDQAGSSPKPDPDAGKAGKPDAYPESLFSIEFEPRNGTDSVGSISVIAAGDGMNMLSTERPGDTLQMSLGAFNFAGGSGSSSTMLSTGEGSEMRFVGKHDLGEGQLVADDGTRVCFRKHKGKWTYVCGVGEYSLGGKVTKLGSARTVDSCLALLEAGEDILREGAARELGRLTGPKDTARVVPRLASLMTESSQYVRRGAAEGLGLIGNQESFLALKNALPSQSDKTTKAFVEEALAVCGGLVLTGDPGAAQMTDSEAAALFLGKDKSKGKSSDGPADRWKGEMVLNRAKARRPEAERALSEKAASNETEVARAAASLLGSLKKAGVS